MTDHKIPCAATITVTPSKENGWCYVIEEDDSGEIHNLRGIGAPRGGAVGDKGTVAYQTGTGFGLWFWSKR